jgi:hypothetical protein
MKMSGRMERNNVEPLILPLSKASQSTLLLFSAFCLDPNTLYDLDSLGLRS